MILLAIAIFIMYRTETAIFRPEKVIPPEVAPLQRFVDDCLTITATDGIRLLAANGGFIRFPQEIQYDPRSYISNSPLPDTKYPLWRYKGQFRIPPEQYMVDDLKYYIESNLGDCLQNLDAFRNMFEIETENISLDIELENTGVYVKMLYPLTMTITQKEQVFNLDEFESFIPLRLKTLYDLANEIMDNENNNLFIERRAIDLISLDPDIPYTDMEFTCQPKMWRVDEVTEKFKLLLENNLPLIRVDKTKYRPVPDDQPYVANHFIWDVTSVKYPTTHVSFSYDPGWPLDFYVSPNKGLILTSNPGRGQDLLSFLCIHMWHFTYDARFPVLATITDDAAKNRESLTFNFAFDAGINSNLPDASNFGSNPFVFDSFSDSESSFCAETPYHILTVHTFENISTDEYGDLTKDIADVNISYTCIRYKCNMGQTEWSFRGAVSILSKEFPFCVNGVLRGSKEGYEDTYTFVSTDKEKKVDLYLNPIVNKDVEVVKHYKLSLQIEEELDNDENAYIKITRKNSTFTSGALYPPIEDMSQIKLLAKWDYTYDVEIFLLDDTGIIGGYKGEWTPAWTELKDAYKIKFHVLEMPYTQDIEEQYEFYTSLDSLSNTIPKPEII